MLNHITHRLNKHLPKPIQQQKAYAILLPLIEENGQLSVLYQVRSQLVPQPGEVAFPGGQIEAQESPEQAALRETCEELNIQPDQIHLLGELDYLVQGTRTVYGFVGLLTIDDWRKLTPNPEVAQLFTVPLDRLMAEPPTYYRLNTQTKPSEDFPITQIPQGANYPFSDSSRMIPFYQQIEPTIWGLTALFTHHFTQLLEQGETSSDC